MPSYGAVIPVRPGQWRYLAECVQSIEDAGWEYAFADEGPFAEDNDSLASALFMAGATTRIRVGSSIAITYLRTAFATAAISKIVNEVSGGRMVLGLGVSHPMITEPLGANTAKPVEHMREYVGNVRSHLGGHDVPIWLAALRPRMCALAGELASTVNLHHLPIGGFGEAIARVRGGEARSGRTKPCQVAAYARIALDDDLEAARHVARETMKAYCALPVYRAIYGAAGFADEMAALEAAFARGDDEAAGRAITDELIDEVLVVGPAARCREQLERFTAAGVDTILFAPLSTLANPTLVERFAPVVQAFRA